MKKKHFLFVPKGFRWNLFVCLFVCLFMQSPAQNNSLAPKVELFFKGEGANQSTKFTATALSAVFDFVTVNGNTTFPITENYNSNEYTHVHAEEPEGWNFVTSLDGDYPAVGFGLYKFQAHDKFFYLDLRDQRYGVEGIIYPSVDVWFKYNDTTGIFSYNNLGFNDPFSAIENGSYLTIWNLKGKGTPLTTNFQNFWNNALAVLLQYNSTGKVTPLVVWGPKPNYSAWGYYVYRSIVDNGQPPGSWTLISTIYNNNQFTFNDVTIDETILSNGGKTAFYKVTAFNDDGQTEPTNIKEIILPYIQNSIEPYYYNEISMSPFIKWASQEGFQHTGFKLYRSVVGLGQPPGTYTLIETFPVPSYMEYHDTSIPSWQTSSGEYVAHYKITAYNQTTETYPGTITQIPLSRFASTVSSTYNQDNVLIPYLSWSSINNFSNLAGYKIYRYIYPIEYQYSLIAQVGPSQLNYSDHTLSVGGNKTAYYKIKGYKSTAESDFSNRTNIDVSWGASKYGRDTTQSLKINERSFFVEQNYPNPFNPKTEIRYHLPISSFVKITVTNILGQRVAELENGYKSEGRHSVAFNASGLPSGIYYYTVQYGARTEIKKMIYIR